MLRWIISLLINKYGVGRVSELILINGYHLASWYNMAIVDLSWINHYLGSNLVMLLVLTIAYYNFFIEWLLIGDIFLELKQSGLD